MPELERMSFTIEKPLLKKLERLMREQGCVNRSEFLRNLVRSRLVEQAWADDEEVLGTITVVYDHHQRELSRKLTAVQHHHHHEVLATTHVHLDKRLCAEMIMMRGNARIIQEMAEAIRQQKGVLHAATALSATGGKLA